MRSPEVGHVTVIGGGLLGTELADGISKRGETTDTKVSLLVKEQGVLAKYLPDYLSNFLTSELRKGKPLMFHFVDNLVGIDVRTNALVKEITENPGTATEEGKLVVHLDDGSQIETDHVGTLDRKSCS